MVTKRVGDVVHVNVAVKNTGNQPFNVYIGASFRNQRTGEWHHLAYEEIFKDFFVPGRVVTLTLPVKTDRASNVLSKPMGEGVYDLYVGVYRRAEGGVVTGSITHNGRVIGRMYKAGTGKLYDPVASKVLRGVLILRPKVTPIYRAEIISVQVI